MQLENNRIYLRPWKKTDAKSLYEITKSDLYEKSTGFTKSNSVEDSLNEIRNIYSADGCYAIVLKSNLKIIGFINMRVGALSIYGAALNEADLDYWVVPEYWYDSYAVDAIRLVLDHYFNDLGIRGVWSGYFVGNDDYFICQRECGFRYHHTEYDKLIMGRKEPKTINVTYLLKEDYLNK